MSMFLRTSIFLLAGCVMSCATEPAGNGDASADGSQQVDTVSPPVDDGLPDLGARLATGVQIQGISLFQSVRIGLYNGQWTASTARNAPIVTGRPGVVRVYANGATGRALTAELRLENAGSAPKVIRDMRTLSGTSSDATPGSFFQLGFAAGDITPTTTISLRIVEASAPTVPDGTSNPARFPADGTQQALEAQSDGQGLNLVLIPIRYNYDGSGRLPDTSTTQLDLARKLMLALYPLSSIRISVHTPIDWAGTANFGSINTQLLALRRSETVPNDAYYYGIVSPATSFSAFCGRSCTTGQSYVVTDPTDGDFRVGSGAWFTGIDSILTLAHEIGHQHGRRHASCGVTNPDLSYPYANGKIGVIGYDSRDGTFPDLRYSDFMSYCEPEWISDYSYKGLFERIRAVNGLALVFQPQSAPHTLLVAHEDGTMDWGPTVDLPSPHSAERARLRWVDGAGRPLQEDTAVALEVSHGDHRLFVAPSAPVNAVRAVWLDAQGRELASALRP